MRRLDDLQRFYQLLARVEERIGGKCLLRDCHGRMGWPRRGVYFLFEPGEQRCETGSGLRVVRVGTHAVTARSRTTLWNRLSQHRGVARTGGGSHRGSVFRLLLGSALQVRYPELRCDTWGIGSTQAGSVRRGEHDLECLVSDRIGRMPVLWVAIDDPPARQSRRAWVERNSISLLSNWGQGDGAIDGASPSWLGLDCPREPVARSGLWNCNHVQDVYDPTFLDVLARFVECM